ncbi:PD-(D/E)XK nuclease domain-containing protein [Psychrobacter sanguinis]|uniref:PD-(D/E)XK nuclease domain-containing protein n=1 Tax=Psychrobacter sanguinis TaxID=861445 RepID=UPI0028B0E099|nr:hypothetical protein [Psychrobacter sanguinis]
MNKNIAIEKLKKLIIEGKSLIDEDDVAKIIKWKKDSDAALRNIFGNNSPNVDSFESISYSLASINSQDMMINSADIAEGIGIATTYLESMKDEVSEYWHETDSLAKNKTDITDNIERIINRFNIIVRQLRSRYSDRPTIEINDEYDVQDLFHVLLKLYFDDVRPEEYTPSYAGANSRIDFVLKDESIIVEIKKSRKTLNAKKLGEELMIDSQRYQAHPDCKRIICFVYDPEGYIDNPKGIESDLSKDMNGIPVSVFIRPE